jgi:hypothetical protein
MLSSSSLHPTVKKEKKFRKAQKNLSRKQNDILEFSKKKMKKKNAAPETGKKKNSVKMKITQQKKGKQGDCKKGNKNCLKSSKKMK